ncbi:nuclear factor 7, ovary-like [Scyliorhinus torazame]
MRSSSRPEMEERKHLENLTKEVSCSICLDFLEEPVSLDCGHGFCRACILGFWLGGDSSCPECRLLSPGKALRPNRQMANIVSTVRSLTLAWQGRGGETVEKLSVSFPTSPNTGHIKRKAKKLTHRFEGEFAELHQILNEEEQEMKRRLNRREQEMLSRGRSGARTTAEMNLSFGQVMWNFLQEVKVLIGGCNESRQESESPVNTLIGEFGGPLQYIVWRQMRKSIKPALTHLNLCAKSAHPSLTLSEGMTRVRVGYLQQKLPDNPSRFQHRLCVLGSQGFTSGRHYWEVEVDQGAKWTLGVVRESVRRGESEDLIARNGYWVVSPHVVNWLQWLLGFFAQRERNLQQVDYLALQLNPKKVGIYLDYEGGQVSFYNAENMSHLYTHKGTMTGKLFAFFSPGTAPNNQMKLLRLSL